MKLIEATSLRLTELMKEKNLNQYKLFKASGVPQSTISTILANENKTIKLDTVYSLCRGFNIEISDFFSSDLFLTLNLED